MLDDVFGSELRLRRRNRWQQKTAKSKSYAVQVHENDLFGLNEYLINMSARNCRVNTQFAILHTSKHGFDPIKVQPHNHPQSNTQLLDHLREVVMADGLATALGIVRSRSACHILTFQSWTNAKGATCAVQSGTPHRSTLIEIWFSQLALAGSRMHSFPSMSDLKPPHWPCR
ncbi:MAG: hypothetical protein AAF479_12075 [Pseudomonadota bacterium]